LLDCIDPGVGGAVGHFHGSDSSCQGNHTFVNSRFNRRGGGFGSRWWWGDGDGVAFLQPMVWRKVVDRRDGRRVIAGVTWRSDISLLVSIGRIRHHNVVFGDRNNY
jgi:hypothetical protein